MNNKIVALFVVLAVVLVGIFLLFKPKPSTPQINQKKQIQEKVDTSKWQLYQNKKFGYEMKYPPDWEITTLGNAPPEDFSAPFFSPKSPTNGQKIYPGVMIGNIGKLNKNETLETDMPLGAGSYKLINKKLIKVGGQNALLVEFFQTGYGRRNGKIGMVRQQIKVINGDTAYLISLDEENENMAVLDSSTLWKNRPTFDAMIDSIRFLNK